MNVRSGVETQSRPQQNLFFNYLHELFGARVGATFVGPRRSSDCLAGWAKVFCMPVPSGFDDCKVGTVLAAGASAEFSITKWVEGDYSGPDHVDVFTAKAVDNDDTEATDDRRRHRRLHRRGAGDRGHQDRRSDGGARDRRRRDLHVRRQEHEHRGAGDHHQPLRLGLRHPRRRRRLQGRHRPGGRRFGRVLDHQVGRGRLLRPRPRRRLHRQGRRQRRHRGHRRPTTPPSTSPTWPRRSRSPRPPTRPRCPRPAAT